MEKVGCIPAYWKVFYPGTSKTKDLEPCKSNQYPDIPNSRTENLDQLPTIFREFSLQHQNPCTEMRSAVSFNSKTFINDIDVSQAERPAGYNKTLGLIINYEDTKYMEIKNTKAYDGETLLSQVGGFVGMYYK